MRTGRWEGVSRLPAPVRAALVAVLAMLVVVLVDLRGDEELSRYLRVGEVASARGFVEADIPEVQLVPGWGHDGQANYVLARTFPDLAAADGHLDSVTYRARRIVYPAAASWLPAGMPTVVGFLVLNLAAVGLAAAAVASIVRRHGGHWLLGASVAVTPAFVASTIISLGDGLGLAFAAAGVARWRRPGATRSATALFVLAALTRETTLVIPLAVFLFEHADRRRWLLLPPAALATWLVVLELWIGDGGKSAAQFTLPFAGWVDQGIASTEIVVAAVLLIASAWVAVRLWSVDRTWAAVLLLDAAVLVTVDRGVLFDPMNLARVVPWVVPFALLVLLPRRHGGSSADEHRLRREADPVVERLVDGAPLGHL